MALEQHLTADLAPADLAQSASLIGGTARKELAAPSPGEGKAKMVEKRDQPVQGINPDASLRIAALHVQILELGSQLASISEALFHEKAKSLALEAAVARLHVIETELSAESSARDAAGAVGTAAVAELGELRLMHESVRREREAARSERDIARAAARAAEARIVELESKVASLLFAGAMNVRPPVPEEGCLEQNREHVRAGSSA